MCHICKQTGERTCNPQEAEIKCFLCGKCAAEKDRKHESTAPSASFSENIMRRFTEVQ